MELQVVILGAGHQARETGEYIEQLGGSVVAYLVDPSYLSTSSKSLTAPLIGFGSAEARRLTRYKAVGGVGYPASRRTIVGQWSGQKFGNVVARSSWAARDVRMGTGVVVAPLAALSVNVELGDHVLVNIGATISHDCKIGNFTTISPGCHIAGNVTVGDGVFVGIGASVIQGITIGDGALIAAGAVVTGDVAPHTMVAGVPAVVKRSQPDWP